MDVLSCTILDIFNPSSCHPLFRLSDTTQTYIVLAEKVLESSLLYVFIMQES